MRKNQYLTESIPRADDYAAWKKVSRKKNQPLGAEFDRDRDRRRSIAFTSRLTPSNVAYLAELDGCYTLKTDVPVQVADKELIHDRYKDLAMVETAFRTCKTSHLEVRAGILSETKANTRGTRIGE